MQHVQQYDRSYSFIFNVLSWAVHLLLSALDFSAAGRRRRKAQVTGRKAPKPSQNGFFATSQGLAGNNYRGTDSISAVARMLAYEQEKSIFLRTYRKNPAVSMSQGNQSHYSGSKNGNNSAIVDNLPKITVFPTGRRCFGTLEFPE